MKQGSPIHASLEHVVFYPERTAETYPTIVALHGRGTDELDLISLVLSLGRTDVMIISPRAPLPFSFGGFAWYSQSQEWVPDPQTFRSSLDLLRQFISEIRRGYPVNSHRVLLLGFSQGTVMAYAVGLMDPSSFRGIVALSGYIPPSPGLPLDLRKLEGFPVFISHGTYDEVIPVKFGREAAEVLKDAGANVMYREYPMAHEVREETIRDLAAWMKQLLE
jgi:phospholipase/carboxylesterase